MENETKSVRLTYWTKPSTVKRVENAAKKYGTSTNAIVDAGVLMFLDEEEELKNLKKFVVDIRKRKPRKVVIKKSK